MLSDSFSPWSPFIKSISGHHRGAVGGGGWVKGLGEEWPGKSMPRQWRNTYIGTSCCPSTYMYPDASASQPDGLFQRSCPSLRLATHATTSITHATTSIKSTPRAPFPWLWRWLLFYLPCKVYFSQPCYIAMASHVDLSHLLDDKLWSRGPALNSPWISCTMQRLLHLHHFLCCSYFERRVCDKAMSSHSICHGFQLS